MFGLSLPLKKAPNIPMSTNIKSQQLYSFLAYISASPEGGSATLPFSTVDINTELSCLTINGLDQSVLKPFKRIGYSIVQDSIVTWAMGSSILL